MYNKESIEKLALTEKKVKRIKCKAKESKAP